MKMYVWKLFVFLGLKSLGRKIYGEEFLCWWEGQPDPYPEYCEEDWLLDEEEE